MPWNVKGKEAFIKVHVDDNSKVTLVGHEEIGYSHAWVPLVEALFHNFHKIIAICRMKDLPEHCLMQTPSHKFKFVCCLNSKIGLHICEKHGSCALLESLPDLHSGGIHRHIPGRLATAETGLKRVCKELDVSCDNQFPDRDAVAFDPKFVEGMGRFHPLMVDWHCSH